MVDWQNLPVDGEPPELDARGVVVLTEEQAAKLEKMGVKATEPAGSVRPCMVEAHEASWRRRPWPMGDVACDVCHPSLETLVAEGYPKTQRNLAPQKVVGRHIAPPAPKWERSSSDLAGQVDSKSVLFGNDL